MAEVRLPRIPDDWQVWACSDVHGVTSGLVTALQEAEIIDTQRHWVAPPKTALVGCGDYIDRGGDIAGLVGMLRRLGIEAAAARGQVVLARGNHEVMPFMARTDPAWLEEWLGFGGRATIRSFGGDPDEATDPDRMADIMNNCAPDLFEWMADLPQAVRWRDVLFVHAGLAPGFGPQDLGVHTDQHLWIRAAWVETSWDDPDLAAYRDAGIERVVFGHTPQLDGPRLYHDGHSLNIDSNAVADPRHGPDAGRALTLVAPGRAARFADARIISTPTAAAPDTMSPT